jgi:6,7-dimethyl-8-ribityllumazine synthase
MKTIEGQLRADGLRFGLVAGRFNSLVVEHMVGGAEDALVRHGADGDDLTLVRVPGSFEIPLAAKRMAASGHYDAIIALGAVIRGSTPHFDYVAAEVTTGLAQVQLDAEMPMGYGVLTTDTVEQAIERAGTKAGNKGADAAMAALEMANVLTRLEG